MIIFQLLGLAVGLATIAIIAHWLITIGAIRTDTGDAVARFKAFMDRALAPIYRPIRKYVQPVNGLDLTPLVALLLLYIAHAVLRWFLILLV
jgi:YggT family protein